MFRNYQVQKYRITKRILDSSIKSLKKNVQRTNSKNKQQNLREFILYSKCLISQIENDIQLKLTPLPVIKNKIQQVIKYLKKCSKDERCENMFRVFSLFKKIQLGFTHKYDSIMQECFQYLSKCQNPKKFLDIFAFQRFDLILIDFFNVRRQKFEILTDKYRQVYKNISENIDKIQRRMLKSQGQQFIHNIQLLKDYENSKRLIESYSTVGKEKEQEKEKGIIFESIKSIHNKRNTPSQQTIISHTNSLKNSKHSRKSRDKGRVSIFGGISNRKSLFTNNVVIKRNPIQNVENIFQAHESGVSITQEKINSSDSLIVAEKTLPTVNQNYIETIGKQINVTKQLGEAKLRQFYLFCSISNSIRLISISEITMTKILGNYKISGKIKGFFDDKIVIRVDQNRFKLSHPDKINEDEYRMILANTIQIQKHFNKLMVTNTGVIDNKYHLNKSIISVKDSNILRQHQGIYRRINCYLFYRFHIPIQPSDTNKIKKHVYNVTANQLYQIQQIDKNIFQETCLNEVIEMDQEDNMRYSGQTKFMIEVEQQNIKRRNYSYNQEYYSLFGNNVLPRKKMPKNNKIQFKTINHNSKRIIVSIQKSCLQGEQQQVWKCGQKYNGLKYARNIQIIEKKHLFKKQKLQYFELFKPRIGIHSQVRSNYNHKNIVHFTKRSKNGYLVCKVELFQQFPNELVVLVFVQSSAKYYIIFVDEGLLRQSCTFEFKDFISNAAQFQSAIKHSIIKNTNFQFQQKDLTMILTFKKYQTKIQANQLFMMNFGVVNNKLTYMQIFYQLKQAKQLKASRSFKKNQTIIVHKLIEFSPKLYNIHYKNIKIDELKREDNKLFYHQKIIKTIKSYLKSIQNLKLTKKEYYYYENLYEGYIKVKLETNRKLIIQQLSGYKVQQIANNSSNNIINKLSGSSLFRYVKRVLKDSSYHLA